MSKGRLEAYTDAVMAIILTIMILELRPPNADSFAALRPLAPVLLSYVLSFVNLAIYWNNHHHMLQGAARVNGAVLWANQNLLFWLTLIPLTTAWIGRQHFTGFAVAAYGFVLMMCGIAYYVLALALVGANGRDSALAEALGRDFKGKASVVIYAVGVLLSPRFPLASCTLYALVAAMWLVPDRRFERR